MEKITLHHTTFAQHQYEPDTHTLYSDWFEATENMTEDDFRDEVEAWIRVSKEVKPTFIYDSCSNFLYPINPEQQIWMAHTLNPAWIEAGVKKYAHILPLEFIANLSVEQLFDEFFNMNLKNQFEIKHFAEEDAEKTKQWFNN